MRAVASVLAERVGPSVQVRCGGCGDTFPLSYRREFEWRKAGRKFRCRTCRRPTRALTDAERARFQRWWLEESGLSRRELTEIALGLALRGT